MLESSKGMCARDNCIDNEINDLRNEYEKILELNDSLPSQIRIPLLDFQSVDSGLDPFYDSLYQDGVNAINIELEDEIEQIRYKREVLEDTYQHLSDDAAYSTLTGLKSNLFVESFVVPKSSEAFDELKKRFLDDTCEVNENNGSNSDPEVISLHDLDDKPNANNKSIGSIEDKISCRSESRKIMRAERREQIRRKMEEKPPDQDDPFDLRTIEELKRNSGDWKLKSLHSYTTSTHKQIDTRLKLIEMILCEDSMRSIKAAFNTEFEALQTERERIVNLVVQKNCEIINISKSIGESVDPGSLWCPSSSETKHKVQREEEVKVDAEIDAFLPQLRPRHEGSPRTLSTPEKQAIKERQILLSHEKSAIINDIASEVKEYDQSLYQLRKKYDRIAVEIKCGELQLIKMMKEIALLSATEDEGKRLLAKQKESKAKLIEIQTCISSQKVMLDEKSIHLQSWLKNSKILAREFETIVPDTHKDHGVLHKIYMRKIQKFDDVNYMSDDDDFDDDSSWESDDEGDECPEGCSEETYQKVLQLRERRLDEEDKFKILKREVGAIKRNHDKLCGRENQSTRELEDVNALLKAYEEKKRKKLNTVPSFVTMSTKQIHLWPAEQPDSNHVDKNSCVVFSKESLRNLFQRIRELQEEIETDKENLKSLQYDKKQLSSEAKSLEKSIARHQEECENLQMLKFGQTIDLQKFDELSECSNQGNSAASVPSNILKAEKENGLLVLRLEKELEALKKEVKDETSKNTEILKQIASFLEREMDLDEKKTVKDVVVQDNSEEINSLRETSKKQREEIMKIKDEIFRLKRKNGHLHTLSPWQESG